MSAQMAAAYRKAADVIRTGGLAKGAYWMGQSHCTVGALSVATSGHADAGVDSLTVSGPVRYLAELLGLDTSDSSMHYGVADWNDRQETTPADVITLLEQAAEKLEADL